MYSSNKMIYDLLYCTFQYKYGASQNKLNGAQTKNKHRQEAYKKDQKANVE